MKNNNLLLGAVTICFFMFIVIFCISATKAASRHQPHTCKWRECPYKGVCKAGADSSVTRYTGQRYTDGWCIDMLHIEYPDLNNDQLDSILFNKRGNRYGY